MAPIGETILLWRLERCLSQEELAGRAGVSRPNLSAVERGKREISLRTLRALALALGVQPGILVDGKSPMELKERIDTSRKTLERIADGVVYGKPVKSQKEKELVGLLRSLTNNRFSVMKGGSRIPYVRKRMINSAWLQLSSGYSPEMVGSLIQRITDREQVLTSQ